MLQLLEHVDNIRKRVGKDISQEHKADLGQFMTPLPVARFMASLFSPTTLQTVRLLDAGAGVGSLSGAFLDRCAAGDFSFCHIKVYAYEIDAVLRKHLSRSLAEYQAELALDVHVSSKDFIEDAIKLITKGGVRFTHAIMNPPYKKINSASRHRSVLRQVGIETVNLYSAFVALTVDLMEPGGQVVAIIPRSFCNGPYYKSFRDFILSRASIKRMHLFNSRSKAFRDDAVLQENVIIVLERGVPQGPITISTSTDDKFTDTKTHAYAFEQIVFPNDPERFIHVPTSPKHSHIELSPLVCFSPADLGLEVSTGPVVAFRVTEHLRHMPAPGTVPLLYPCHFVGHRIVWPKPDSKKPNAIVRTDETEKWLYPNGYYVVVRRFSSKEEKRRIVASVVDPHTLPSSMIGIENHLNVIHCGKRGIDKALAYGLAAFLNSTAVDDQFRRFSGHTQVNATDLRLLKYPSRTALNRLALWVKNQTELTQQKIDRKVESSAWQKTTT